VDLSTSSARRSVLDLTLAEATGQALEHLARPLPRVGLRAWSIRAAVGWFAAVAAVRVLPWGLETNDDFFIMTVLG